MFCTIKRLFINICQQTFITEFIEVHLLDKCWMETGGWMGQETDPVTSYKRQCCRWNMFKGSKFDIPQHESLMHQYQYLKCFNQVNITEFYKSSCINNGFGFPMQKHLKLFHKWWNFTNNRSIYKQKSDTNNHPMSTYARSHNRF